ncbi:MAG TPA: hypothetical protein VHZ75_02285 [Solirubrobacteraceae bacterium]|jgi:hypothetical protein|nr:hypothetical protein [Solirubrobacteraceae bacterium]
MKKVVSLVAVPSRALGRLLLRILRLLGKPFARLGRLPGKARIVVYAVIAIVIVGGVVVLKPKKNEEPAVRAVLVEYGKASAAKDYQKLCDDLLSNELVERIRSVGLPCEVAMRTGLQNRVDPQLTVLAVDVTGDHALARVRGTAAGEAPADANFELVKESGRWRIATSPGSDSTKAP